MLTKYFKPGVLTLLFAIACIKPAGAQTEAQINDSLVQFSGLVLSHDSLMTLSNVNIRIKETYFGTKSNELGIFSFVTRKGDTVLFSAVGYKSRQYVVPSSLKGQRYSMVLTLASDTFELNPIIIKPFISKALLPHYFVTTDVPEAEEDIIARRNLESEFLRQQAATMGADGPENQKLQLRQEAAKYYYAGQMPPQNILNPIAWAQFFNAWKKGAYKRKK